MQPDMLIQGVAQVQDPPPSIGSELIAPIVMLVGVVMIGVILTMSIRGKIARRKAATLPPRERLEDIKARSKVRQNLERHEVEMLDTAQRVAAQLDAKTMQLEKLILEADARIADLDRRLGTGFRPTASLGPDSALGAGTGAGAGSPRVPEIVSARPAPGRPALDPLTASVYELADAGHKPLDIARRLDEQIGKVELILALREAG